MSRPAPPDLFDAAAETERVRVAPLAAAMRPTSLDEVVGQSHLLSKGAALRTLIEQDRLSSAVFFGPPGTGKTTVARLVATSTGKAFVALSAVAAGVSDVRQVLGDAHRRLGTEGRGTILFLDEIHRFSRSQQDALLPGVEDGTLVLIGATTENPFFSLNAPLLSRSTLFRFEPLSEDELAVVLRRAAAARGVDCAPEAIEATARLCDGDARAALTTIDVAISLALARDEGGTTPAAVGLADVEAARTTRALRMSRDDHYDLASALIKSLRGSDPDAGLYWFARLLEAGEDPRFVARRLVILASEDVGMADPTALLVAVAAAEALERVGLPEAMLNLAQAVVHLALAPKSNRTAAALWAAEGDVRNGPTAEVPAQLRDAHYSGATKLGHGLGYEYPHDDPLGFVGGSYLPERLGGRRYYVPSSHGLEAELGERLEGLRRAKQGVGAEDHDRSGARHDL